MVRDGRTFNIYLYILLWWQNIEINAILRISNTLISEFYDQYGVMVSSFGATPVIQRFQNKVLKYNVQAPWYIRNSDFLRDLGIDTFTDIITRLARSHKKRLHNHINSEVSRLLIVQNIPRRLKRKKPFELVKQ
jgi:hypothetical protein